MPEEEAEAVLTAEGYVVPDGRVFQHRLVLLDAESGAAKVQARYVVYTNDLTLTGRRITAALVSSHSEATAGFWIESITTISQQ